MRVQCRMIARAVIALVALAFIQTRAQPTSIWVDVEAPPPSDEPELQDSEEEVEKRYTPELLEALESTKEDALLLYTEFTGRSSQSMKHFISTMRNLENDINQKLEPGLLDKAPSSCRVEYQQRLKNVIRNARRAASFSGENHHKFFLGHMIVFRMHLNKSEEFVQRSKTAVAKCRLSGNNETPSTSSKFCENQPRVKRWRRMALDELNRVRDDMQHSRRMYRDILTHAQRRLNTVRRKTYAEAHAAHDQLRDCTIRETNVQ